MERAITFFTLFFIHAEIKAWDPKTFVLRSTSSSIKDLLRKKTSDAYQQGIFGAPTFVANNRIFWGQDRIEFVIKEASK